MRCSTDLTYQGIKIAAVRKPREKFSSLVEKGRGRRRERKGAEMMLEVETTGTHFRAVELGFLSLWE